MTFVPIHDCHCTVVLADAALPLNSELAEHTCVYVWPSFKDNHCGGSCTTFGIVPSQEAGSTSKANSFSIETTTPMQNKEAVCAQEMDIPQLYERNIKLACYGPV